MAVFQLEMDEIRRVTDIHTRLREHLRTVNRAAMAIAAIMPLDPEEPIDAATQEAWDRFYADVGTLRTLLREMEIPLMTPSGAFVDNWLALKEAAFAYPSRLRRELKGDAGASTSIEEEIELLAVKVELGLALAIRRFKRGKPTFEDDLISLPEMERLWRARFDTMPIVGTEEDTQRAASQRLFRRNSI